MYIVCTSYTVAVMILLSSSETIIFATNCQIDTVLVLHFRNRFILRRRLIWCYFRSRLIDIEKLLIASTPVAQSSKILSVITNWEEKNRIKPTKQGKELKSSSHVHMISNWEEKNRIKLTKQEKELSSSYVKMWNRLIEA